MNTSDAAGTKGDAIPEEAANRVWLDVLTGRATADPASPEQQDASLIRAYFMKQDELDRGAPNEVTDPDEEERAMHRILFAARREGLLGPDSPVPATARGPGGSTAKSTVRVFSWRQLGGIAAAVLLGALVVTHLRLSNPEDPTYGPPPTAMGTESTQQLTDTNPRSRAEAMAKALKEADVPARIYQQEQVYLLQIEILPERFDAVRAAVARTGVVPEPGIVQVRISKP